ncbi:iron complex transport system ATP-binding protein [Sporobacter termitidis DSM 10068]|uniref:Iron complex transport system ATP-binding protein n=1 Tax=Sporobacter termitidis DSM 10068 TaxID=1123282 RepID=A0A1M5WLM2_9FIRM|nr:ABC transporter ATP-binding protein [Sporobacter termitidis]SHH88455.1 iron complex transport system ATP-binding protein [Sporobacter termitidis DSM 10068]
MVCVENIRFSYGDTPVLQGVSLTVKAGVVTTLMGANGCGKTTLLNLMTKNLRPDAGHVTLDGTDIQSMRLKEFARCAAIVHQKNSAPDDLSVRKLVSYGRLPYCSMLRSQRGEDLEKVEWALSATDMTALADRPMGALSGGERQRAFLSMALAQGTRLLYLDEPTTFLDVRYQVELLRLIRRLNRELGITIVMVLHDINQALCYSDEVVGLKDGAVFCQGPPNQVISQETIHALYGIRLEVCRQNKTLWVMTV